MVRLCGAGARGGASEWVIGALCELTGGGLCETGGLGAGRGGEEACDEGEGALRLL